MGDSAPDERMYERIDSRYERFRLKFLLNLNRYVLTAGLALGLFSAIVGMSTLGELSLREMMGPDRLVRPAFQTMLLPITTSVTLVVTISQLVLSQELGPLGDQRERMDGERSFREDVEVLLGTASPPEPNAFLRLTPSNWLSSTVVNFFVLRDCFAGLVDQSRLADINDEHQWKDNRHGTALLCTRR